nr:aldehyde dehydrogenase family protein [Pseudoalteromonas telluritireducens]
MTIKNNVNFINGEYVSSSNSDTISVLSPSTGEQVGVIPKGSVEDAQTALETATVAQNAWAQKNAT